MRKSLLTIFAFGAMAVVLGFSGAPASAQASRTFVSGVGSDANPCSRTAPCKTFAGAISKTATGGEIDALDPGGYGAVTITKSITIDGGGGQVASVLVSGTNGIVVQTPGASDTVILRNLRITGINGSGLNGIRSTSAGGRLYIENCDIFGFSQSGIDVETSGSSLTYVSNTSVTDNNSAGVMVKPSSGSAHATMFGVRADQNSQGFLIGPPGAGATAVVTISGSSATMNSTGVNVNGTGAQLLLGSSHVTLNGTGVSVAAPATAQSNQNNEINQNGTDVNGTLSPAPLK